MLACEDKGKLEREVLAWCDRLEQFRLKRIAKKLGCFSTDINESSFIKVHGSEHPYTSLLSVRDQQLRLNGNLVVELNPCGLLQVMLVEWRGPR